MKLVFFSVLVVYSLLWLVVPWSRAVALFIAGAAFLWILFFSSLIVNVKRREIIAALALSIPFAFAALSTEALIWYGLGPLATLIWLIYLARGTYGGWLKGIFFVLGTIWLHVLILLVVDVATGGVLTRAYGVGLHPFQRWNVPVIATADAATLLIAAEIMKRLLKPRR
ncbi:MAG: hypothetical protein QW680_08290 [Pyrobaculum sp.]|uniref:P. aerophilum family 550 protein n=2 Tax=Pyrobaculum aerophilum TaxID=13773 RepID=Q8ZWK1_PYRAE|nr:MULTISPECIES: hypothetical protein [Pyrobaculum]AAL63701.1 P. aerophilum family 550 protein [Pyrobaculum aerophilum str. IM2]MCX8137745.1 hypothetical protein [Pyrobaculum aerophilum]RFA96896.1 hypothetical protein CGL51_04270 [Pyrobaculum aerophilum]RFA98394.1 hypothetical protein CGL52_07115 [Pyrobaculum aerophilum]HII46347.1 hypothetical protein [Pyrobaculum aerophilum]